MAGDTAGEAGAAARQLLAQARFAVLASELAAADQAAPPERCQPYATLVQVAPQRDGTVLLLLSDLARHTRNLAANPRASLLIDGTGDGPDRLAGARLALIGAVAPAPDQAAAKAAFLAAHPGAAQYADFGDFRLHAFACECGDLVAGFGRIERIPAAGLTAF